MILHNYGNRLQISALLAVFEIKQELEFQTSPAICIESLIAINKKVGQPQAALGKNSAIAAKGALDQR